ncbi:hypothetical protein [Staphylococcus simulans]|uniref:hypothetical protein n=1 Tax=Staphylococcus simulans TaxID=1286 RepID=UPI000F717BBC|nr:hypothetical protein [Staphylococcus simulans]VED60533.1 phage protein [Staphylococcus simulans]
MKYKYMEKQVEGAKALAEKYPHMQTHQDIYREHVEVLEKAKMFDGIKDYILEKIDMLEVRQEHAKSPSQFEYFGNLLTAFKALKNKIEILEREE